MSDDRRKATCYWEKPGDFTYVRLTPDGEPVKTNLDDEGSLYIIDEDGERTYLTFG